MKLGELPDKKLQGSAPNTLDLLSRKAYGWYTMRTRKGEAGIPRNDTYTVPPWGDHYQESQRHRRGNFDGYPCAICGKDIPVATVRYGGIVTTAGEWTTDPDHPHSQGWFPVGSQCHRKYAIRCNTRPLPTSLSVEG